MGQLAAQKSLMSGGNMKEVSRELIYTDVKVKEVLDI